jgi:hypothetical protein
MATREDVIWSRSAFRPFSVARCRFALFFSPFEVLLVGPKRRPQRRFAAFHAVQHSLGAATLAAGGVAGADFRAPLRLAGDDFAADVDLRAAAAFGAVGRDTVPDVDLAARPPRPPVAGVRLAVVFFLFGLLPMAIMTSPPGTPARSTGSVDSPAPRTTASTVGDPLRFSDGFITRFPNRDRFAAYNGTAPIEVSSGHHEIYRLSRRGNSFANPTVTVGRRFSDTFAGIAPSSVPPFIAMQLLGAVIGTGIVLTLYPDAGQRADDVVIPHTNAHQPTVKASS